MRHYLVIANRSLTDAAFEDWVTGCLAEGPVHLHLVVPVVPIEGRINWTDEEARENARRRLRAAVQRLRDIGALASGEVSRDDPVVAAVAAIRRPGYDTIVRLDEKALLPSVA